MWCWFLFLFISFRAIWAALLSSDRKLCSCGNTEKDSKDAPKTWHIYTFFAFKCIKKDWIFWDPQQQLILSYKNFCFLALISRNFKIPC